MKNKQLFAAVVEYVYRITHPSYYNGEEWVSDDNICPFASFEEAVVAYHKHQQRVENRSFTTIDSVWRRRYAKALSDKGFPRYPMLRRRNHNYKHD